EGAKKFKVPRPYIDHAKRKGFIKAIEDTSPARFTVEGLEALKKRYDDNDRLPKPGTKERVLEDKQAGRLWPLADVADRLGKQSNEILQLQRHQSRKMEPGWRCAPVRRDA